MLLKLRQEFTTIPIVASGTSLFMVHLLYMPRLNHLVNSYFQVRDSTMKLDMSK